MRVLVIGATGLIGSSVCARLAAAGHEVVGLMRPGSAPRPTGLAATIELDMARATRPADWAPHLVDIGAVVNCAGVLQQSVRERTREVHETGAAALFMACEELGIRRVVHFSAIGVDRAQPSAFSATKLAGDRALMERDLDWVILRPAVVLGPAAFGASALFRGLAALPVVPSMGGTGELQVVQSEDVVATVVALIDPIAPSRMVLELAGPTRHSMDEIVAIHRRWLGWREARTVTLPPWLAALLYRLGDLAGALGWRPPMRSTAGKEIGRGATGDPTRWSEITGIVPTSLAAALEARPVSVQERWFAKLYFLKPVIFVILVLFWFMTGVISLTVGYDVGLDLMRQGGIDALAAPGVVAGALADIAIACAIAWRATARPGLYAAIALSLFYVVAGTVLLPWLWEEPLGPLMKIWPILALHLVALAILDER